MTANGQRAATSYFGEWELGDTLTLFMKLEFTWTDGRVSEMLEDSPFIDSPRGMQGANRELTAFSYDGNGFLKSSRTDIIFNGTKTLKSVRRFTVDVKGNIVKAEEDRYYKGEFQQTYKESMQYDDKINPEWLLQSPRGFAVHFSPNNIIKHTWENDNPLLVLTTTYTYKYNAAGLPVEVSRKQGNDRPNVLYYDYYK